MELVNAQKYYFRALPMDSIFIFAVGKMHVPLPQAAAYSTHPRRIETDSNPHSHKTKTPKPLGLGVGLVGDGGFEPPKA